MRKAKDIVFIFRMLRLVLLSCQRSQQPLRTHFPRNPGVVVSMFTHFFMLCYSCACLMGGGDSVLLHRCICGRTGVLPYMEWNWNIRRNLSAAACMDYTSPTTARMSEPRSGASCRAVVEISECNSYMPQRLDSLRRDMFLFKWYSRSFWNKRVLTTVIFNPVLQDMC